MALNVLANRISTLFCTKPRVTIRSVAMQGNDGGLNTCAYTSQVTANDPHRPRNLSMFSSSLKSGSSILHLATAMMPNSSVNHLLTGFVAKAGESSQ